MGKSFKNAAGTRGNVYNFESAPVPEENSNERRDVVDHNDHNVHNDHNDHIAHTEHSAPIDTENKATHTATTRKKTAGKGTSKPSATHGRGANAQEDENRSERFPLMVTPSTMDFLRTVSKIQGDSVNDYINSIIAREKEDKKELYEKIKSFQSSL